MSIYSHLDSFYGLGIEHFDKAKGIQNETLTLRIEVDYEAGDEGHTILAELEALANDSKSNAIRALIIGSWEEAFETDIQPLIDYLVENNHQFSNLKAIFFAEMTAEENEISWIQQGDYSAFWAAYPQLEQLQIRGMEGLDFGSIDHQNLKTLIVETGGLDSASIAQISNSNLPSLQHLELWLGSEDYGWDGTIDDITPLLNAAHWPSLSYLGLKNSEIVDEIVPAVVTNSILKQLSILDLSMGTLTDKGAEFIVANKENLSHLMKLNLAHHYLSDSMMHTLSGLGFPVDVSDQEEADDDYRYVEVSE